MAMSSTRSESWESPLVPDSILPEQLVDLLGGARLQPEKRLQLAVLEDAVMVLHRCVGDERPRVRRLLAELDEWFASTATDSPFGFETICETLALDSAYLRRGLERLRTGDARRLRFRRGATGTRHQIVLNDGLRRSA